MVVEEGVVVEYVVFVHPAVTHLLNVIFRRGETNSEDGQKHRARETSQLSPLYRVIYNVIL